MKKISMQFRKIGPHGETTCNMGLNGFLLIELMIGLLISTLFMVIITHYIIEVKSAQQKALEKIESFSTARNEIEKKFQKTKE